MEDYEKKEEKQHREDRMTEAGRHTAGFAEIQNGLGSPFDLSKIISSNKESWLDKHKFLLGF